MIASLSLGTKTRYPAGSRGTTPDAGASVPLSAAAHAEADSNAIWPSISAVITTRDRPQLLERAIESIIGQDYPGELEVIVVFDQSDIDPELAGVRNGRSVRTIVNSHLPGLPGGRNSGVAASSSDLIALCDDDDEWLPLKLRQQVAVLAQQPQASTVTSGIVVQYGDVETIRLPDLARVTFTDLLRSRVSWVHPSTIMVRRLRWVDSIGDVNEHIPGGYGEDYEWLLRAARDADIAVSQVASTRVHWHKKSFFAQRWYTIIEALQWLLNEYPEFASEPQGLARIEGQLAFAHAAAGERFAASKWAARSLRHRPTEARGGLALAVAAGVPADRILMALHNRGKGI